jgi:hypothetical protein
VVQHFHGEKREINTANGHSKGPFFFLAQCLQNERTKNK